MGAPWDDADRLLWTSPSLSSASPSVELRDAATSPHPDPFAEEFAWLRDANASLQTRQWGDAAAWRNVDG
eukprot:gene10432-1410_t